jgi:hypothetical protein
MVAIVRGASAPLGMETARYLADLLERRLYPLSEEQAAPLPIEGTLAGRALQLDDLVRTTGPASSRAVLWVPVVNGTQRLGAAARRRHPAADGTADTAGYHAAALPLLRRRYPELPDSDLASPHLDN